MLQFLSASVTENISCFETGTFQKPVKNLQSARSLDENSQFVRQRSPCPRAKKTLGFHKAKGSRYSCFWWLVEILFMTFISLTQLLLWTDVNTKREKHNWAFSECATQSRAWKSTVVANLQIPERISHYDACSKVPHCPSVPLQAHMHTPPQLDV